MSGSEGALARLLEQRVISFLDLHFATTLNRLVPSEENVLVGAALASRAVQRGHVCADLVRLGESPLLDADDNPVALAMLPPLAALSEALARSPLAGDGATATPLVFEGGRLYLYRYYQYQRRLAQQLRARALGVEDLEMDRTRKDIERLFPRTGRGREPDRQRLALAVAVSRRLTVISGGPGTGKTSVVVKILALLQERAQRKGQRPLSIALLAPTGKAAARLGEAIARSLETLRIDAGVQAAIPRIASTVHRALGFQPRTPTRFRHHAGNPLSADVVLVDEASMVDLALLSKLVDAVAPSARLILLGDKDQLASVEAGAILGDICGERSEPAFSQTFAAELTALTGERVATTGELHARGLSDCIVPLAKSYRYGEHSGIGALARAINAGDAPLALAILQGEREGTPQRTLSVDVALIELEGEGSKGEGSLERALGPAIDEGFGPALKATDPGERLALLGRFRILCPHRAGPAGVLAVNELVLARLARRGLLVPGREWYEGRPILVLQNDYQLDLWNGDIGVIARRDERLGAFFTGTGRSPGLRSFLPARLPPHETVFAMTVHKSQGSEFDRVALLIPERTSPFVTRELIYTAVSRARQRVEIYGTPAVLRAALGRRVERASGLAAMLSAP